MQIKGRVYALYKRLQWFWPLATLASFIYTEMLPRSGWRRPAPLLGENHPGPRIAFICDEMTWQDFAPECQALFLTPHGWLAALEEFKPELLFCESLWSGIAARPDCWRGRGYKSGPVRRENRRALLDILAWCRANRVPTIFWNKEDPAFFGNRTYDFVDTALRFDYIYTTAAECVAGYARLGGRNVNVLPFGFSPRIFYPDDAVEKENTAVFAGSWYGDQPGRCQELSRLFDLVLEKGIELVIYDRQSESSNPVHRYPYQYQAYIRHAVPFTALGDIFRRSRYVINVNTVTSSETMFARRVYEAMACRCIIISNVSKGLKKQFAGRIWFLNEPFDHANSSVIAAANCRDVFTKHTCQKRLEQIVNVLKEK
ncbi:MAG: hypothetical protein FWC60_04275 [Firmicutes bacterium]|nr:hypothetical protein [Bacillota bacterium]